MFLRNSSLYRKKNEISSPLAKSCLAPRSRRGGENGDIPFASGSSPAGPCLREHRGGEPRLILDVSTAMAPTETGVPAAGDALLRWRCDGAVLGPGGGERSRRPAGEQNGPGGRGSQGALAGEGTASRTALCSLGAAPDGRGVRYVRDGPQFPPLFLEFFI